jgi:hypothetical protein
MPKEYGKGAMSYGNKGSKSGKGYGASKLGPRFANTPTALSPTAMSPKRSATKSTTKQMYKTPKAAGSKAIRSTRTPYGDKGAGNTTTRSSHKTRTAGGSKPMKKSYMGKSTTNSEYKSKKTPGSKMVY